MKKFLCFFAILLFAQSLYAQVKVSGYYKKNGTYVEPHYRSSPDKNPYNNYSFPGNENPYTGKIATGNPDTYLENYYKIKGSSSYANLNGAPLPNFHESEYNGDFFVFPYSYSNVNFSTSILVNKTIYKILNVGDDKFYLTDKNSIPLGYIIIRKGKIRRVLDMYDREVQSFSYLK